MEQLLTIASLVGGMGIGGGFLKLWQIIATRKKLKAEVYDVLSEGVVQMSDSLLKWAEQFRSENSVLRNENAKLRNDITKAKDLIEGNEVD